MNHGPDLTEPPACAYCGGTIVSHDPLCRVMVLDCLDEPDDWADYVGENY